MNALHHLADYVDSHQDLLRSVNLHVLVYKSPDEFAEFVTALDGDSRWEATQSDYYDERTITFGEGVTLQVYAGRTDLKKCERVQVGTELKEVPVYETRCPDAA